MRWWLAAFALLVSGCLQSPMTTDPSQAAVAATVPDPLQAGPYQVTRLDYDFGYFVVDDPELVPFHYVVPLHGSLHLPAGDGPFPIVALMHGRHGTCDYAGTLEFFSTGACPSAVVVEPVNSYTGYDGLAELLASHGYAVASIDANAINDKDLAGDAGANARGALALRTLDELAAVNQTGQGRGDLGGLPTAIPANTPGTNLAPAQGRLDLGRVGLMGHSRGGEGVARAVSLDAERSGGHGLDAIFALAPTDFARWPVAGVPFATLLPYCDGDVSNLQGAWMYDDARRLEPAAPRHQVLAMGANHNFYNTVWTGDDWGTTGKWCGTDVEGSGRDSPEQQRAHGYGLMASFFRLYVGGEAAFAPMWDGADSVWPASLCPGRPSCADRLLASAMPVRHLDLTDPDTPGLPSRPDHLGSIACEPAQCPMQPVLAGGRLATWDCDGNGTARFNIDATFADWTSLSLRLGGATTGPTLWLEALPSHARSSPLAYPPRPGGDDSSKAVLSEVRVDLASLGADLATTTELVLHCDGVEPDNDLLVTDLMLV